MIIPSGSQDIRDLQHVIEIIKKSNRIVMLTGAGVSTESGLPDYRGSAGFRSNPAEALKLMAPLMEKVKKFQYPEGIRTNPCYKLFFNYDIFLFIKPNSAHHAIVDMEKLNKLHCLISQNVENLHIDSGFPRKKLLELHGNCFRVVCKECNIFYDGLKIRKNILKDVTYMPSCRKCGGKLVSSIIDFGDPLPEEALKRAIEESGNCRVFIAVGSTLNVTPAADMFDYARSNGAVTVIINIGKTGKDRLADFIFREKAGMVLPNLVKGLQN